MVRPTPRGSPGNIQGVLSVSLLLAPAPMKSLWGGPVSWPDVLNSDSNYSAFCSNAPSCRAPPFPYPHLPMPVLILIISKNYFSPIEGHSNVNPFQFSLIIISNLVPLDIQTNCPNFSLLNGYFQLRVANNLFFTRTTMTLPLNGRCHCWPIMYNIFINRRNCNQSIIPRSVNELLSSSPTCKINLYEKNSIEHFFM